MQDPLNNWNEGNFESIEGRGVYVDNGVGTSISSVSRVTEPAISCPPQAGSDPELFQQQEHSVPERPGQIFTLDVPKAAPKLAAAPSTPLASS